MDENNENKVDENKVAELIAEHYHRTYDLTYALWSERNKIFLILLGVIGVATILTLRATETAPLLVYLIAKTLGITDAAQINELRSSFPFGLIQAILLIVVFYLMVNLHHRSLYVLRNYSYLAALEKEIHEHLKLSTAAVAFTREGKYYWGSRGFLQGAVKWTYMLLLGALLFTFLAGRVLEDIRTGHRVLALVEVLIGIAIMVYYGAYVRSSRTLDSEAAVLRSEAKTDAGTKAPTGT